MITTSSSAAIVGALVGVMLGPTLYCWAATTSRGARTEPVERGRTPMSAKAALMSAVLLASTFGVLGWRWGQMPEVLAWWWLAATGYVLAAVDWASRRLPFPQTAAMVGGVLILLAASAYQDSRWDQLAGSAVAGIAVLAAAGAVQLMAPTHTGGGDTALYGALATCLGWLGWTGLLRGLLIATAATALAAVTQWARHGNRSTIAAGPTLIAGTIATIMLANPVDAA